jgi:hypothetical protein
MLNLFLRRAALLALALLAWAAEVQAQCSQCKAAAGTRDEHGNLVVGQDINLGILYLLALPVFLPLIVGTLWWWKNRQAARAKQA